MKLQELEDFVACGVAAQTAVDRVIEAAADPAYTGLVKYHAQELAKLETFRRSGKLSTNQVHAIKKDLDQLDRKHSLDDTVERILAAVDALELERQALQSTCVGPGGRGAPGCINCDGTGQVVL